MLDGLQTVPWYDLHAATGTAEEVPDLLRRLADEDLQQRSDALEHLRELIYHQTSLYTASSASVPFLIELATTPTVHDRDQIVDLLAGVASGWRPEDRTWWLQMQQDPAALERHLDAMITTKQWATYPNPAWLRESFREEFVARHEAHEAARAALPRLLLLLGDADAGVRRALLHFLAVFDQDYAVILPAVRERVRAEHDESVVATAIDQLGTIGSGSTWCHDVCLEILHDHPAHAVRVAAANALVRVQPEQPAPDALCLLAQVYAQPALAEGLPEQPIYLHTLGASFAQWPEEWSLSMLGPEQLEIVVPIMLTGLTAPLMAAACRDLVGRLIALLYRYTGVRESTDPRVVALRCAFTRQAIPALLGLEWGTLEWFDAFQTAQVLIPLIYTYATVTEAETAWLERQRGAALNTLAAQGFWYRDNIDVIATAADLLAAMVASTHQRTPLTLTDEEQRMTATIVRALAGWGLSSQRQSVAAWLREQHLLSTGS